MTSIIIENKSQLIESLSKGCKPKSDWKIGTEHEKFGFIKDNLAALPYEGEQGIQKVLEGLSGSGWNPVYENDKIIALLMKDHGSITLEPGGQLELSGGLLDNIHETCRESYQHLEHVKQVADPMGIGFIGMGFQPLLKRSDIHWMPKGRYKIMQRYMPTVGEYGLDMMLRTCTVQVNLDFSSEADMIKKFRVSLALQPLATALFANSPFTEGKPNGFVSFRSQVWAKTDPQRCGMLPWVFEPDMSFEKYVDYMLNVPMYFVYRDGQYHDAAGQSFLDFMEGKLPSLPGQLPTMQDWEDHLTTVFPEVRLKQYLEMRGADAGPWNRLCALPAFWTGLFYDQNALDQAWGLVADWTDQEREDLRNAVPKTGIKTPFRDSTLQEIALKVLSLSESGLKARQRFNNSGSDESLYLGELWRIAESGMTPAERKLERYHGEWNQSLRPLFKECAF